VEETGGEVMIIGIIQSRMGSSRFPGKALADIAGKPMIQRVIERVKGALSLDKIELAVPGGKENQPLLVIGATCSVIRYIDVDGEENDVLGRFVRGMIPWVNVTTVVRMTGDCPLICPDIIDETVEYFLKGNYDIVYNIPRYPEGTDVEVMKCSALLRANEATINSYHREHVTTYLYEHPKEFKVGIMPGNCGQHHWSVDQEEDLKFTRFVYESVSEDFSINQVFELEKEFIK
jgi:spore coat polysaccharide biosynthesis protein SpsF